MALLAVFNSVLFCYAWNHGPSTARSDSSLTFYLGVPYVFQTVWRSILISEYFDRRVSTGYFLNAPLFARLLAVVGELCYGA